jgi:molybdate transport system substrate-binding protein
MARWLRLLLLIAATWLGQPAHAAELKVLATGATRHTLTALTPEFTRVHGIAVALDFGTAGEIERRAKTEPADLVIVPVPRLEALIQEAVIAKGSRMDVARAALALAVRDGAPTPDISSVEALIRVLIQARSVAFTDPKAGGTAGIYFAGLLQRLGIADALRDKAVLARGGRDAVERVGRGEAEFAITFVSEILPVPGVKVAGVLPDAVQHYTIYAAGVAAKSAQAESAQAFAKFLTSVANRDRWRADGLEALSVGQ